MTVNLLHHTPLKVCSYAIRTCYNSHHKSDDGGKEDMRLICRVGKEYGHTSVIEHIVFTFDIQGISRACLQELARHRMASLSVKSTRYTLRELTTLKTPSESCTTEVLECFRKFVVPVNAPIERHSLKTLKRIRSMMKEGMPIDRAKYMLPESYKTSLVWTINFRSLLNFLDLRTNKRALWEIRKLAFKILDLIPHELAPFIKEFKEREHEDIL